MRRTVRAVVLMAALLALATPADAGPSLASVSRLAKQADKRAKAAQRDARRALAAVQAHPLVSLPVRGDRGEKGSNGTGGLTGRDDKDGVTGARGAEGAQGPAGADGRDGADGNAGRDGTNGRDGRDGSDGVDGADALAALRIDSVTNAQTVDVGDGTTTVLATTVEREGAGSVLVHVEGQVNGENSISDGMACDLRAGATVEDRFFTVPALSQVAVAASTVAHLEAGNHTFSFACRKSASGSHVSFPARRVRLSVVGG